ncbi:MAG: hypothetical protein ACOH1T_08850 [Microbacteriaceae bacterium]
MAEIVLFHHVQSPTAGVQTFADELRRAGHTVHTPDLFDGHTFATIDDGMKYTGGIEASDPGAFARLADQAVAGLPDAVVYAGFSFGIATDVKGFEKHLQFGRATKNGLAFDHNVGKFETLRLPDTVTLTVGRKSPTAMDR